LGNLIYTELIKMKRSKMFLISLLGALVSPVLTFFMLIGYNNQNPDTILSFKSFFSQTHLFIVFIIGNMLFALITTYIFNREFEEDTLKNLLTIPVGRIKLIISKLVVLFGWIQIILIFAFISVFILGSIAGFEGINMSMIVNYIQKYIFTGLLLYLLIPSIILITILFKNYVPPLAFSIFVTMGVVIFGQSKYLAFYPWGIPVLMTVDGQSIVYPIIYSWLIIGGLFVISLLINFIHFKNKDLN